MGRDKQSPSGGAGRWNAHVQELRQLFAQGNHARLERRAQQMVSRSPEFALGWKVLSIAQLLQGRDALDAARRSVELLPDDAEAHNNLAKALQDAGRHEESRQACLQALRIEPGFALAYNNFGIALAQLGMVGEAQAAYERALELSPLFADAALNLGHLHARLGHVDHAVEAYRRASQAEPTSTRAGRALARMLVDLGRLDEAIAACKADAMRNPQDVVALDDLSAMLSRRGQHDLALTYADAALALNARHASAHNNRGVALLGLNRLADARSALERAAALDNRLAQAHVNLGNVLREMLLPSEAVAAYRRAVETAPDNPDLQSHLLLAANYLDDTSGLPLQCALQTQNLRATARSHWDRHGDPAKPLRIGMVSGDFRNHPVGRFLVGVLPALRQHDVELFGYYNHWAEDDTTVSLRSSFSAWRDVAGWPDDRLAESIESDGVDILVDLAGHTETGRMDTFARKPAPVQVAWFGYFASTGLEAMDYILADGIVLPETDDGQFVEQPYRLPHAYYCYSPPAEAPEVGPLPSSLGAAFTFGCFNSTAKLNDRVIVNWGRILRQVPEARLYLKSRQYAYPGVREAVIQRLAASGVNAQRVHFEGSGTLKQYLEAHAQVDIALDTFPFSGGATTADALWMGVPVLTMKGHNFISRQGESILRCVDLGDWLAIDDADYVRRAVERALHRDGLAALRYGLRQRLANSPFGDLPGFARDLNAAFRHMWALWCERQKP